MAEVHNGTPVVLDVNNRQERMQQDYAWIHDAQAGEDAFGDLYLRYYPAILRYASFKLGESEAHDVTSEVFVRALASLDTFEITDSPVSAWIYRIATNIVTDRIRRANRSGGQVLLDDAEAMTAVSFGENQILATIDIKNAIKLLTEEQAEVVMLRFFGGLSSAEVAEILGKGEGAVRALQHRALLGLRSALAGDNGYY